MVNSSALSVFAGFSGQLLAARWTNGCSACIERNVSYWLENGLFLTYPIISALVAVESLVLAGRGGADLDRKRT